MTLQFETYPDGSGAFTDPEESSWDIVEHFDRLMDARDAGALSVTGYIKALEAMTKEHPDFIDAYAHIASAYLEQGKTKKALDAAMRGLAVGNRLIPEGFQGTMEWGHIENRPFLRALHNAMLCHARLRKHRDAAALIEKMLSYNPNDNQGVRFLLGSEYLRAGERALAIPILEANAPSFPPCYFDLAFAHLDTGNWVPAATALRRGFCANVYIAEMIGGHPRPLPLPLWHGSSDAAVDTAYDYLDMYGRAWAREVFHRDFVRWLFNHSKVMMERAAIMACNEELTWALNPQERGLILEKREALRNAIDDRLSKELVVPKIDRRGDKTLPWYLLKH